MITAVILAGWFVVQCHSDCYMHNPRGSNDRNCERNVNRNNGNRLFDSQNNNKGGYACPRAVGDGSFQSEAGKATFLDESGNYFNQSKRMYYYSGSILPIEWTEQHGCGGNSKVNCEIVLQYACEDTLDPRVDNFWPWVANKAEPSTTYYGKQHFRSGNNIAAPRDGVPTDANDAATDTITNTEAAAIPNTDATRRFGMQESFDYYTLCSYTERNKGLFTADQQINRNDQRGTRQNPNGNRHGFECNEERDYYPWWQPSPWIDIAVLTDSAGDSECYPTSTSCTVRCAYYMNNTMNFHKKGYCDVNHASSTATVQTKLNSKAWNSNSWYNNRAACEGAGYNWYEISHSDNLVLAQNSFVCAKTAFARVNHLGNTAQTPIFSQSQLTSAGVVSTHITQGVNANRFLWTIPNIPTAKADQSYFSSMSSAYQSCVLRIRYNLSSGDYQQWPQQAVDLGSKRMVDHYNNSKTRTDTNSPIHQDPYVYIGPGDTSSRGDMFLSLKLNTNQYGRTFQDRSYVFSIKPLPLSTSPENNYADTPSINATAIAHALKNGGRIYNVNVRGKRGNIVQVYPAVEYDFVPNALALNTNDMVHFQWTGSDYNPRRGCNDASGGPPDANTFSTDANANQNPRADRSNVVLTYHMANNYPKDYLGYSYTNTSLSYSYKQATAMDTVLKNAPCYDPSTDSEATATTCYNTMMRLAYLNQQSDIGSLILRANKPCLTATQLDNINNQDIQDFHPLNCAKMNAKPYPYFDGGVMIMKKYGWFSYYSSRNNNFSNRQNIGVICVGPNCKVDNTTNVLQDTNPQTNENEVTNSAASQCYDTASGSNGANTNGAHSCLPATTTATTTTTASNIITGDTTSTQEGDNDSKGDGNAQGCATLTFSDIQNSVEEQVALAFILLAVGLFTSWLAYFLYNRYQLHRSGESKFRYDTAWQKGSATIETARPASVALKHPGIKMSRMGIDSSSSSPTKSSGGSTKNAMTSPARATSPKLAKAAAVPTSSSLPRPSAPPKSPKRQEMI